MGRPVRLGNHSYVKNETNLVVGISGGCIDLLKLLMEHKTGLSKTETNKEDYPHEFETRV